MPREGGCFCVVEYALVPAEILSVYIYGEGPAG